MGDVRRWPRGRVRDLFNDALERTPRARRRFLLDACAGDSGLCREVESLLDAYVDGGGFPRLDDAIPALRRPERVGSYELLDELGRGGQATVYRARHLETSAEVALKVLVDPVGSSDETRRRFEREAASAMRLDHPGVCRVLEAGRDGDIWFIAMELVHGEALAEWIARARELDDEGPVALPTKGRDETTLVRSVDRVLELFVAIASALHHAHERGLVHRDIKPGNIVIRESGDPVVLDFGLVRDLESSLASMTRSADVLGTPHYLAPEQLATERVQVDRRADVYSLGVTLYECLTLSRPFDAATRDGLYRRILVGGAPDPRRFRSDLPRDLTSVIDVVLEVDPRRRYPSAAAFAADLEAVRCGRRPRARRASPAARAAQWMRRNPVWSTISIASFVLVAVALGVSLAMLAEVEHALQRLRTTSLVQTSAEVGRSDPELGFLLAREAVRRARNAETLSQLQESLGDLTPSRVFGEHDSKLVGAAFSPRGDRVLTRASGAAWLFTTRGDLLAAFTDPPVRAATFVGDGGDVVTVSAEGVVVLRDEDGIERRVLADHGLPIADVGFSPDGRTMVTCGVEGGATLTRIADGERLATDVGGTSVVRCAVSDSGWFVTGHANGDAHVFRASGEPVAALPGNGRVVQQVVISTRGTIAVRDMRGVRLWSHERDAIVELRDHADNVTAMAFSPDGACFVTACADHSLRLWDESGELVHRMTGHAAPVERVAFSPDGTRIVSGSSDASVRIWELQGHCERVLRGHGAAVFAMSFSPDGRRLLTAAADRTARLWELRSPSSVVLRGHALGLYDVQCSPSGRRVVTASRDRTARIWTSTGEPLAVLRGHDGVVFSSGFVGGDDVVFTTDYGSTARYWSADGSLLRVRVSDTGRYFGNPDPTGADRALARDASGAIRIEAADGATIARLEGHRSSIWWAEFMPDGLHVLTASADRTARLWNLDGTVHADFVGHGDRVRSARPSASGRYVVTASDDGTAAVWTRNGERLATLIGHQAEVLHAAFAPDESRVVTCSRDATARIWTIDGKLERVLRGHEGIVWVATFAPDGSVWTASSDRTARRWVLDPDELVALADRYVRPFSGAERARFADLLGR